MKYKPKGKEPYLEPPVGGADLECLLACRQLSFSSVSKTMVVCRANDFEVLEDEGFLVYGPDPITPVYVGTRGDLADMLDRLKPEEVSQCILRTQGRLVDMDTPINITFHLKHEVVVLGLPENRLWAPHDTPQHLDFRRLLFFGRICREVAQRVGAELAYISTEELHPDEMRVSVAESSGARSPARALSHESLLELAEWYKEEYGRRWSSSTRDWRC